MDFVIATILDGLSHCKYAYICTTERDCGSRGESWGPCRVQNLEVH